RPRLIELNAAAFGGAQRLANLEKIVERAAELTRQDGLSLGRVVERLREELEEAPTQGESPLADEAVQAVRLMTIHQSKGLEFPCVVLPDIARLRLPGGGGRGTAARVTSRDGL